MNTVSEVPKRTDKDFIQSASVTAMMRSLLNIEGGKFKNPDYLAKDFVSEPWKQFLNDSTSSIQNLEKRLPGGVYYLLVRTRYFDLSMENWIKHNKKSQIVSLGTGFDTRSIRLNKQPNEVTFFDVDLKAMLDYKVDILNNLDLPDFKNIKYVPTNFQTDDAFENLREQGFDESIPTYFLCEGVSFFLENHIFDELLKNIKNLQSKKSILAFDYAFKDYIDGNLDYFGAKETQAELKTIGEPHVFGINYEDINEYLEQRGFTARNNYTASMLDSLYLSDNHVWQNERRSTGFLGLTEAVVMEDEHNE